MTDYQSMFSDIGGAASDLFTSYGAFQSASSYRTAASIDLQNEQLEKESVAVQEVQMARKINMALGSEQADTAGAGFTSGGSAQDLLRSSAEQGALEKGLIQLQGTIKENEFANMAQAAKASASAANTSGIAGIFGGLIKGAAALFAL